MEVVHVNVSGACRIAFVMTSCGKGIQEQEPGWEYFCGKADLKLAVASKERLLFMYVNPRATVDSTSPGEEGPTLWLTLLWLGKFWKSSGSVSTAKGIHTMRSEAHSRPGTPALGTAGLMIPAFRNSTLPDTCRRNPVDW